MLTDRQNQILSYIWENDSEFIKQANIASEFDISTRLVQMEIREINSFLMNMDAQIKTKRNHGVYIEINNEEYLMEYFETVDKKERFNDLNNPRQRILQIIEYLLYQDEFTHYETLCGKFLISKSTLSTDLEKIKSIIEKQKLKIDSNQTKGIRIEGSELNKRRMLMNIFNSEMKEGLNPEYLNESGLMEDISDKLIEIFIQKHYKASDVVIQNIIMHIYVATKRVLSGQHLIYNLTDDERIELKNELEISKEIYYLLASTYDFEIREGEINHLAYNIYAKRNHYRKDVITTEIDNHVLSILEIVKDKWMIDLSYDIELRIALALHLVPLKKRLEKDMQLPNTMEQEIMQNYSLGYELAIIAGKYFEELTNQKISNSEVSYLALHFNLSVEKLNNHLGRKKILVITTSRRGETLLINNRLKKWFPELISNIDFINIFELAEISKEDYDIILSTTLNDEMIPDSAIKINYFLKEVDRVRIERALLGYSEYDSIISYFNEDLFLNIKSNTSFENIIRIMSDQIFAIGENIPDNLYASVIRREELGFTNFGNFIAMPHPDERVTEETYICTAILDKPIQRGEEKVQLIFLVSIGKKKNEDLKLVFEFLSKLFVDRDSILDIIEGKTYSNFIKNLKRMVNN